jgi:hypothetical protein
MSTCGPCDSALESCGLSVQISAGVRADGSVPAFIAQGQDVPPLLLILPYSVLSSRYEISRKKDKCSPKS